VSSEFDVIVVGGGGSGLAAAYSVAQRGGRVLLLEKQPTLGGTTAIAVGSYTAAGTSLQKTAEIEDSAADHAIDAGKFAAPEIEALNEPQLRAFFLEQAAETFEWLRSLGLSFHGPSPEPPNRVPRMHNVVPGARAYIGTLHRALRKLDATILCEADVRELLRDAGRVVGVRAIVDNEERQFRATRGVVLAAGDYANDPELISRHKGPRFTKIRGINPHASGDGHRLAEAAGAELLNMGVTYGPELRFIAPKRTSLLEWLPDGGRIVRFVTAVARGMPSRLMDSFTKRLLVTWQHPENALYRDGAILVNRRGERFTDETSSPSREIDVAQQTQGEAFILLDQRLIERYSAWPHFISTAPEIAYAYVADYRRLRADVMASGYTLGDLAELRGMAPDTLVETVEQFNRFCNGQQADPHGRLDTPPPMETGPWVFMGPVKASFTTTEGGARIDQSFQVLDHEGQPIAGLHAVGQTGLGGMILWGHGLHIAWALTSGRLVGEVLMR
jgi:fumarate reductase flavoprotein subunit